MHYAEMLARIACIRNQTLNRPALDLICRPHVLLTSHPGSVPFL